MVARGARAGWINRPRAEEKDPESLDFWAGVLASFFCY